MVFISACSDILGIKTPQETTQKKTIEYLLKYKLDTDNIIFLRPNYFDTLKQKPFKPGWDTGFRPIQFKIFNKYGNLIFQYSPCEGPLKNTLIYDTFPPKNITPIDTSYTIKNEQLLTSNKIIIKKNTDYIAIIYWATYTGIIGRKFLKKTDKLLKSKKNIQVYKLNVDYIK